MKNTFNLPRYFYRGKHPYMVKMPDGSTKLLFEVTAKTGYGSILMLQEQFKDKIIFATTSFDLQAQPFQDAADIYDTLKVGGFSLFYFDIKVGKFYKTVVMETILVGNTSKRLVIT
ncbi:MAG: hypothetical protein WCL51_17815, partial [Bacteroidota bacterium]